MTDLPTSPFPALLVGLPILVATLSLFFRPKGKALIGLTGSLLTAVLAIFAFVEVLKDVMKRKGYQERRKPIAK